MKLSKNEKKRNDEALKLLQQDVLSHEDKCKIYEEFNEGHLGDVTGFGVLSFASLIRDTYEHNIKKIILIERNRPYIEVGQKLVQSVERTYYERGEEKVHRTEVVWIHGDMFDQKMWEKIEEEHGKIDCIISNPPFGKISKTECSRDWLKYTGSELDVAALEIGLLKAEYASYILPQGSCTFKGSGRPYFEHVENRKIDKLKKEMGMDFYMAWTSIDTSVYEQNFKNTKVVVECCTLDRNV